MASSNPSRTSPVPTDALRPVFAGDLNVFSLVDVIQLVCVIHGVHRVVVSDEGRELGRMLVAAAEVVSARSLEAEGDEAFVELSRLPGGTVQAFPTTYEAEADLPRLSRSWQELALEAARLEDEERRDSTVGDEPAAVPPAVPPSVTLLAPPPPAAASSEPAPITEPTLPTAAPSPLPPAPAFSDLYRDAVSAYVHRDYARALTLFDECLALRPGDRAVRHNLERLAKFRRQP